MPTCSLVATSLAFPKAVSSAYLHGPGKEDLSSSSTNCDGITSTGKPCSHRSSAATRLSHTQVCTCLVIAAGPHAQLAGLTMFSSSCLRRGEALASTTLRPARRRFRGPNMTGSKFALCTQHCIKLLKRWTGRCRFCSAVGPCVREGSPTVCVSMRMCVSMRVCVSMGMCVSWVCVCLCVKERGPMLRHLSCQYVLGR